MGEERKKVCEKEARSRPKAQGTFERTAVTLAERVDFEGRGSAVEGVAFGVVEDDSRK